MTTCQLGLICHVLICPCLSVHICNACENSKTNSKKEKKKKGEKKRKNNKKTKKYFLMSYYLYNEFYFIFLLNMIQLSLNKQKTILFRWFVFIIIILAICMIFSLLSHYITYKKQMVNIKHHNLVFHFNNWYRWSFSRNSYSHWTI